MIDRDLGIGCSKAVRRIGQLGATPDGHYPNAIWLPLVSTRQELIATATKWLSLWNTPVDWALFDSIHSETFEDCASSGRPTTKQGFARGLAQLARAFPDLRT